MKFVVCIKAFEDFKEGKIYPIVGDNNGINIAYQKPNGDGAILIVHNYVEDDWKDAIMKDPSGYNKAEFKFIDFGFGI